MEYIVKQHGLMYGVFIKGEEGDIIEKDSVWQDYDAANDHADLLNQQENIRKENNKIGMRKHRLERNFYQYRKKHFKK